MGNCKDCRHWKSDSFLCCAVDVITVDYPNGDDPPGGETECVIAVSESDERPSAGLKTGPLFGCVQFQLAPKKGL